MIHEALTQSGSPPKSAYPNNWPVMRESPDIATLWAGASWCEGELRLLPRGRWQRFHFMAANPRIHELPTFDGKALNIVIETPKGSRAKMKYDQDFGGFRFEKLLPVGQAFPFDFGFLPSTQAPDGDPLDVLLLSEEPVPVGCLVLGKVIGVLEAKQSQNGHSERNDRVIAIPLDGKSREPMFPAPHFDKTLAKAITDFFVTYNELQGKKFAPLGMRSAARALQHIKRAMKHGRQTK